MNGWGHRFALGLGLGGRGVWRRSQGGARVMPYLPFAVLVLAQAWVSRAGAACVAPEPVVLWSYPADGQTDVPTDADLWVTGVEGAPELDGVPLEPTEYGGYDLGQLLASTSYRVEWASFDPDSPLAITFTTSTGPADPTTLEPTNVVFTRNAGFVRCELVPPQGCFDMGPPTRVEFDAGPAPVAWIVDRLWCDGSRSTMLWPAVCGAPVLEGEPIQCASLRATDGVSVGPSTPTLCSAPTLPAGSSLATSSGCTQPFPPDGVLTIESENNEEISSAPVDVPSADPSQPTEDGSTPSVNGVESESAEPDAAACSAVGPSSPALAPWLLGLGVLAMLRRHR